MRNGALPSLCLLLLLAITPLAHAQVFRCIGAQGEPVFSGEPCGNPVPPPGGAGGEGAGGPVAPVCAATAAALRQAIATAFARRDVNQLAGLILWRGLDTAAVRSGLLDLSAWLQQPLSGIAIAYANGPPAGPGAFAPAAAASRADVPAPPPMGIEVSTGGAEGGNRDFGVTRFGGCWWLTF